MAKNPRVSSDSRADGYLNGLGWLAMGSEEKATYLLGFDAGVQTAAGQAAFAAGLKPKLEDTVLAELLVRNRPGLDVSNEIDGILQRRQ